MTFGEYAKIQREGETPGAGSADSHQEAAQAADGRTDGVGIGPHETEANDGSSDAPVEATGSVDAAGGPDGEEVDEKDALDGGQDNVGQGGVEGDVTGEYLPFG